MAWKRYAEDDISRLIREVEVHCNSGLDVVSAYRAAGVSDKTYYGSPRLTCRVTRGVGGARACGTGAALGYSAASGDGLTLFNATVEFDNVADTKNGSLTSNVEHNF